MDQKQKEQLRVLLEARKRSEQFLAQRREEQRKKLEYEQHRMVNQGLIEQYTRELTALAERSGILSLAEEAACQRGGRLTCKLSCYIDYGFNSSNLERALVAAEKGPQQRRLRPAHLALWITWDEESAESTRPTTREVEIRVHPRGQVTFANSLLPVFPFLYRRFPHLLERMLERALQHARAVGQLREGKVRRKNISAEDCEHKEE